VTKPYKTRADFAGAEAILTSLSSLQMQKIVSNEAKDLGKYGLDKPAVTVTVMSGSTRAALALGKKDGDSVYARDLSRPLVFTVSSTAAADLDKNADSLRPQGHVRRTPRSTRRASNSAAAGKLSSSKNRRARRQGRLKNAAGRTSTPRGRGHA